jgi:hypothetical protein
MIASREYLVSYGALGDFGRFRPSAPLDLLRGDLAVIRTARGVEVGEVMREATARHARILSETAVGDILRRVNDEDERAIGLLRDRAADFFEEATRQSSEAPLPLLVLDAELLLDGEHAVLHFVRWQECDIRPLVSGLSRRFAVSVLAQDLTREAEAEAEQGCGSCGEGGCGSGGCGDGGCNSCGTVKPEEVQAYFASLREKMIARNRVALL